MEANIYILSSLKKESAMPKLLDAIYKKHLKVLLYCNTDEDMQNIDALLWRYSKLSFLPHGTSEDTHKDKHPIYITKDVLDIQSNTEILYIDEDLDEVLNHESKKFLQKKFKKIICMYESHSDDDLIKKRINYCNSINASLSIFKEDQGIWQKEHL